MAKKNPTPDEMRKLLVETRAGLREVQRELQAAIALLQRILDQRPPAASER